MDPEKDGNECYNLNLDSNGIPHQSEEVQTCARDEHFCQVGDVGRVRQHFRNRIFRCSKNCWTGALAHCGFG